jgi:hypothetical protein
MESSPPEGVRPGRQAAVLRTVLAKVDGTAWFNLIGLLFLVYLGGMILSDLLRQSLPDIPIESTSHVAIAGLTLLKLLGEWPRTRRRYCTATNENRNLAARLTALVPEDLLGFLRFNGAAMKGFAGWVKRARPTPRSGGVNIGFLKRSSYGTVMAIALVALFSDIPVSALMLYTNQHDKAHRPLVLAFVGVLFVYSFILLMSDRWLVSNSTHVITNRSFDFEIGARMRGSIPRALIRRCNCLSESMDAWLERNQVDSSQTAKVSPFDRPNAVIEIDTANGETYVRLGVQKPLPHYLFLYVDDPSCLMHALAASASG